MAAKPTFHLILNGDPEHARNAVHRALEARKFRVNWGTPWTATAQRGNPVANAIAGAFAQHIRLDVQLATTEHGHTQLTVTRTSTAAMGGAIGVSRTNKAFSELHRDLHTAFTAAGVLMPPPPQPTEPAPAEAYGLPSPPPPSPGTVA